MNNVTKPNAAADSEKSQLTVKEKTVILAAMTAYAAAIQRQIDKEPNDAIRAFREEDRNIAVTIKQRLQAGVLF